MKKYFFALLVSLSCGCEKINFDSEKSMTSADCAPNEIIYKTQYDTPLVFPEDAVFIGINLISNTYNKGVGRLIFDIDITNIGSIFSNCNSLTHIILPVGVKEISKTFNSCINLRSIILPNTLITIGSDTFSGCNSLTSITIPNNIKSIDSGAFSGCSSLTSITIPNSVKSIGYEAFAFCSSLVSVYCKPTIPPSGAGYMFTSNAANRKIYVPQSSVDTYKSTSGWRNYTEDIVGYDF